MRIVLVFGGLHAVIRIVQPTTSFAARLLIGHKLSIHDLKIHPSDPSILLSASKDHTLRLWNIESGVCIAIFGGVQGHIEQVVSADFNATGNKIVSGSGDYSMKIWHLDKWPINKLIESSFSVPIQSDRPFRTVTIHYPEFSTSKVHSNIVDCVKWLGAAILSKVCFKAIVNERINSF